MAQEERRAVLNFLYKDRGLIDSIYAQFFSGLLKNIEQQEGSEEISGGDGKVSLGVTSVLFKGSDKVTNGRKEVIDPHDAVLLDVLQELQPALKHEADATGFGDVVYAEGKLYVFDKKIADFGLDAYGKIPQMPGAPQKGKAERKQEESALKFVRTLMDMPQSDARFSFFSAGGREFVGSLDQEHLTESVISLLLKFGACPIPVSIVGIVENPGEDYASAANPFPVGSLNHASLETVRAMSFFAGRTQGTTPLRPIAIFYRINA